MLLSLECVFAAVIGLSCVTERCVARGGRLNGLVAQAPQLVSTLFVVGGSTAFDTVHFSGSRARRRKVPLLASTFTTLESMRSKMRHTLVYIYPVQVASTV